MRSEVIFRYNTNYRGRYDDEHTQEIVISAEFGGTASWPYTVKEFTEATRYDYYSDSLEVVEPRTEVRCHRISKEAFDRMARDVAYFATKEGLTAHAKSATVRLDEE